MRSPHCKLPADWAAGTARIHCPAQRPPVRKTIPCTCSLWYSASRGHCIARCRFAADKRPAFRLRADRNCILRLHTRPGISGVCRFAPARRHTPATPPKGLFPPRCRLQRRPGETRRSEMPAARNVCCSPAPRYGFQRRSPQGPRCILISA